MRRRESGASEISRRVDLVRRFQETHSAPLLVNEDSCCDFTSQSRLPVVNNPKT